jgi:hypothetical protein
MPSGYGWIDSEIAELKDAGASVLGNNSAGNTVLVGEVVSTYKTNATGQADNSFKYLNYIDTATEAREFIVASTQIEFAQHRLTDGPEIAGRKMVNKAGFKNALARYYDILAGSSYVLLRAGAAKQFFLDSLVITLDLSAGSITYQGSLPIQTQSRVIDSTFQVTFNLA